MIVEDKIEIPTVGLRREYFFAQNIADGR